MLANYLWDSVPQDAYEVGEGKVSALHVGLLTEDDPELMTSVPEIIRNARLKLARAPVDAGALPAGCAALLEADAAALGAPTAVLMPTAAAACLAWFAARGPLLALSADKGVSRPGHLIDGEALPVTLHGDTASLTVDFRALRAAVEARGGWCMDGDGDEPLFLHHLAAEGLAPGALSHALLAFEQAFSGGHGYALYQLCRSTSEEGVLPSLPRLQAMLKLTGWDPDVVWTFGRALRAYIDGGLDEADAAWVVEALRRVGENTYALPDDEDDVDVQIAELAAAIGAPAVAEAAWQRAIVNLGPTAARLHGRAVALSMLGRPAEALACVKEALMLPISHQRHAELTQWSFALEAWAQIASGDLAVPWEE